MSKKKPKQSSALHAHPAVAAARHADLLRRLSGASTGAWRGRQFKAGLACKIAGADDDSVRGWRRRKFLQLDQDGGFYAALDIMRIGAMSSLSAKAGLPPATAAQVVRKLDVSFKSRLSGNGPINPLFAVTATWHDEYGQPRTEAWHYDDLDTAVEGVRRLYFDMPPHHLHIVDLSPLMERVFAELLRTEA